MIAHLLSEHYVTLWCMLPTSDLETVVNELRVTRTTFRSIFGFLELFILELEAGTEQTGRQTDKQTAS